MEGFFIAMKNKIKWFETWFDSEYYPILYQNRDYSEAEHFLSNLTKELTPSPQNSFLDMACGEGRHSIYLNKLGYSVTGIDLSERSINLAKKHSSDTLKFSIEDMRDFDLDEKYDYVFNLFTSFGYFDDLKENEMVIQQVVKHLKKNGTLVLDFFNSKKVIAGMKPYEKKELQGITFHISKTIENNQIVKTIDIEDGEVKKKYQEKVQLLDPQYFKSVLYKFGFEVQKIFGDYDLNNFNEIDSDRLIIFATQN